MILALTLKRGVALTHAARSPVATAAAVRRVARYPLLELLDSAMATWTDRDMYWGSVYWGSHSSRRPDAERRGILELA